MSKFIIKQLILENFRGYKGKHVLDLGRGVVAIYGEVGAGKSSIAQAIEYALYGQQLEIKERIAKLVDLVNEESSEAKVQLSLEDLETGRCMKVLRYLKKHGDSAREALAELWIDDKKIASSPKDVLQHVVELLKLDEDDFARFVLVTHRVLEGLVYGTSSKRSLVIDRLFGIEMIEQLHKSIPIRKLEEILEKEKRKLSAFKELPEIVSKYGSVQNAKKALEEYKRELEELRRTEQELSTKLSELLEKRRQLLERFADLESTYVKYLRVRAERESLEEELKDAPEVSETSIKVELELVKNILLSKLEELLFTEEAEELSRLTITSQNLEEASMKIFEIVKKLEDNLSKFDEEIENLIHLSEELKIDAEKLSTEIRSLERRLRELEDIYREYQSLVSKYGSPEQVQRELEKLKERLQSMEEFELHVEHVLREIVRRGLSTCPICGRPIDENVMRSIEEKISKLSSERTSAEIEEVRRKITELENVLSKIRAIKPLVEEYEELYTRLKTLREMYSKVLSKLETVDKNRRSLEKRAQIIRTLIDEIKERIDRIDREISILRKIKKLKELRREEKELEKKLKESGIDLEALRRLEHDIDNLNKMLDKVRERLNMLSIEISTLERVLSSLPTETIDELRERVYKLERLLNMLNTIRGALKKIQSELRERMVERVRGLVDQYFRLMYPYNDMSGASIELNIKERLGTIVSEYVLYGVRGGRRVPISRMSDGQRLTLALAFMLSVYVVANHNVSFMIMDEPIPYVDEAIRASFAKLVTSLVREGLVNQLIVTSQSREFIEQVVSEASLNEIPVTFIRIVREGSQRRIEVERR
ncbi:MAG: SMC family ATPase [Crenarchaeota archaeon]|nr:SMC family ATPase [Thermoproteota archaeon]